MPCYLSDESKQILLPGIGGEKTLLFILRDEYLGLSSARKSLTLVEFVKNVPEQWLIASRTDSNCARENDRDFIQFKRNHS